jgi:hypothetical protein
VSKDAEFLKGRFLFSNWDVGEMKARAGEIKEKDLLVLGEHRWPVRK